MRLFGRSRNSSWVLSVVIATLLLLGLSCSNDSDEPASAGPTTASSPTPAAIASEAVSKATLSIEDMEEGWSEYELEDDPMNASRVGGQFSSYDVPTVARALVAFAQGQEQAFVPQGFITNTVVLAESESKAIESMTRLRSAAATKEWEQDFPEAVTTFKSATLSINPVGDERVALRLSLTDRSKATGDDFDYTRDVVYYRIGPVITVVSVQLADTGSYVRKSEAKVRQLVSGALN